MSDGVGLIIPSILRSASASEPKAASVAGVAVLWQSSNIKARLSDLAEHVLDGEVDKGIASVASQILNVYLRAVSVELKVKEVTELETRLQELEELMERQGERQSYGA